MITDCDCGPRIVENVGNLLSSYDIIDRCCLCYAHGRTTVMQSCVYKITLNSTSEKLNFQTFSWGQCSCMKNMCSGQLIWIVVMNTQTLSRIVLPENGSQMQTNNINTCSPVDGMSPI